MAEYCQKCGANLDLVGRTHRCRDPFAAPSLPSQPQEGQQLTAVNREPAPAVNAVNKRRGAYPDNEKRREYMREYMRKKRTFGKGKI